MKKINLFIRILFLYISVYGICCKPVVRPKETEIITEDSTIVNPFPDTNYVRRDTTTIRNSDSSLFASDRFGEKNIFTRSELESEEGTYWTANDFIGRAIHLRYTFRAPANDTMKYRPLIVLLHSGAFIYGERQNEDEKAILLSQKGYATATIDYRLGFNGGAENNPCGGNNMEVYQALYRSTQDVNVALHYFMDQAERLGIDSRNVILSGTSAGGMAITARQYMTEGDFNKLRSGIVNILGKQDPFEERSPFRIKAILTNLGHAIVQSSYITPANAKPGLFFQRTGDNILAYERGRLYSCPEYFYTEGAKNMADKLRLLKVPFEVNYEPLDGHQLNYSDEYMTNNYAKFVKRLWGGDRRQIVNENYTTKENVKL